MNKVVIEDLQTLAATILASVLLAAMTAIPFSEAIEIDYKSIFSTLLGLNIVLCLTLMLVRYEFLDSGIYRHQLGWCRIQTVWPPLLATAWICFSPSLDALEIQQLPNALKNSGFWWAAWYTKLGVSLVIISAGCAINNLVKTQYVNINYRFSL